jgi:NAD(P) transhydrogenase subunit alpha
VPGRKAPVLVTEDAVQGMRTGSVIIDMAAASGGNCVLTQAGRIVEKHGVKIVGLLNYPAMLPADSSLFFGNNIFNLLDLLMQKKDQKLEANVNFEDDILAACIVTYQGQVRWNAKK